MPVQRHEYHFFHIKPYVCIFCSKKRAKGKKSGSRSENAFTAGAVAAIELGIVKHNCVHKVIGTENKNCLKVTWIFCDRYVKQVNTIRQAGAFLRAGMYYRVINMDWPYSRQLLWLFFTREQAVLDIPNSDFKKQNVVPFSVIKRTQKNTCSLVKKCHK